ncbi:hypothetical protein [Paenibacillus marinisediminis]
MKKISSLLVVISMLFTVFGGTSYADSTVTLKGTEIRNDNIEQFLSNLKFSGNEDEVEMNMINYSISDSGVDIKGEVTYERDRVKTPFHLSGEMFKSNTQKNVSNSYSGKLIDLQSNFEVMLFFIKDNTYEYKPTINKELLDSQIIQIYLKDKYNNLLAFETKLENITIGDLKNITKEADPGNDFLWFTRLVDAPITVNPAPTTPLSNSSVYLSTNVYSRTQNYAGQVIQENVRGEVWGQIVDVGSSGTSTAYSKIVLAESTYIDGKLHSNSSNFQIHNGAVSLNDMIGKVALGYNTTVNKSVWSGTYYKYGILTGDISLDFGIGLAGKLLSATLPLSFSYVDTKVKDENSVSFYASNGNYPKTAMVKVKKTDKTFLKDNGDFYNLVATISTIDSSETKDYSTTAKFGWTFGIYYSTENNPIASFTDFGPSTTYKSNAS